VRVVDAHHKRSPRGEIECEPVQPMKRLRADAPIRAIVCHPQNWPSIPCGAVEERGSLLGRGPAYGGLDELAGDPEGNSSVEITGACL
jgi:hypothetical protein